MPLPQSEELSTSAMNRVFDDTTATYKFYWLLALLDMHVKEQLDEMLALKVAARMVAYAWYPIEYFNLSFGKGDSMETIITMADCIHQKFTSSPVRIIHEYIFTCRTYRYGATIGNSSINKSLQFL